jgi:hypothetical protein
MRLPRIGALALAAAVALAAAGAAAQELGSWHRKLDDGLKAAKKSGRPVLVVTNWKPDI